LVIDLDLSTLHLGLSLAADTKPSPGDGFRNITAGIASIVTASAVLIGGYWAYFKFVRGRTYKPRLSLDIAAQWRKLDSCDALHIRIRVTNIGASQVSLNQHGTGLHLSFPAAEQSEPPDDVRWTKVPLREDDGESSENNQGKRARWSRACLRRTVDRVLWGIRLKREAAAAPPSQTSSTPRTFEIFKEHSWIEPGETVSDDLLIALDRSPTIAMLEVALLWGVRRRKHERFRRKDVEVFARRIIPPETAMIDKMTEADQPNPNVKPQEGAASGGGKHRKPISEVD
jgi:hypothetical protein